MPTPTPTLFIDDDDIFIEVVRRTCRSFESVSEVLTASNGEEGIALLERLAPEPDSLPGVIFVDINMPVMNGFEFLEAFAELRSRYASLAKVRPIAVLSSSEEVGDRSRAESLGADAYVVKGFGIEETRAALAPFFDRSDSEAA